MPDVWFDQGCAWLGTGVGNPFAEIGDDLGIALGAELATSDYVIEDGFASLTEAPGLNVTIDEDALCTLNSMPLVAEDSFNRLQTTAPTVSLSASKDLTRLARAST